MTEAQIKSDIVAYLRKLPRTYVRIIQIGVIPGRKNCSAGIPDLLVISNGRTFLIEVKSPNGTLRPEQRNFIDAWTICGGTAFVARSLDDVIRRICQ